MGREADRHWPWHQGEGQRSQEERRAGGLSGITGDLPLARPAKPHHRKRGKTKQRWETWCSRCGRQLDPRDRGHCFYCAKQAVGRLPPEVIGSPFLCPMCGAPLPVLRADGGFRAGACRVCGCGRKRKRGPEQMASVVEQMLARDGHRCLRCGATELLTRDHVVPVSRGGTNDLKNLQTLCRACNNWKGARIIDFRRK